MMISKRKISIGLAFLISLTAWGYDYSRGVNLEWEAIEGADGYDVEWFSGSDCSEKGGLEHVKTPKWDHKLQAGMYCTRVRAVNQALGPGHWSEKQRLEVLPKAPSSISTTADGVSWDTVPYARAYQVEVVDSAGKSLGVKTVSKTSLSASEILGYSSQGLNGEYQLQVRTLVAGVKPSAPAKHSFAISSPGIAGGKPAMVARKDLNQDSFNLDEAVGRYEATGEKFAPPTLEEWASVRTEEQKKKLRDRSLASQEIELRERVDVQTKPDLRFTLGAGAESNSLREKTPYGAPSGTADTRTHSTQRLDFAVEYNRSRPWGVRFGIASRSFELPSARGNRTDLKLGVERHYRLDGIGESTSFWRAGIAYTQFPLVVDSLNPNRDSTTPLSVFGLDLAAGLRIRMAHSWSLEGELQVEPIPYQKSVGSVLRANGVSGGVELGPVFHLDSQWDIGVKYQLEAANVNLPKTPNAGSVSLVENLLKVTGSFRLDPNAERMVASVSGRTLETVYRMPGLWLFEAGLPMGLRNATATTGTQVGNVVVTQKERFSLGQRLGLWRRLGGESRWALGANLEHSQAGVGEKLSNEDALALGAAYQWPLFGKKDFLAEWRTQLQVRSWTFHNGNTSWDLKSRDLVTGLEAEKFMTDRFGVYGGMGITLPLSVKYPQGEKGLFGGSGGTSFGWNTKLGTAFHLEQTQKLSVGYRLVQQRLSDSESPQDVRTNDYVEHLLDVGYSISW